MVEMLEPRPGDAFRHEGYYVQIRTLFPVITAALIKKYFPNGNENNCERALLLLKGGNVIAQSINVVHCWSLTDSILNDIVLFQVNCVPSMKTNVLSANQESGKSPRQGYAVYLAFAKTEERESGESRLKLLDFPYSCCGCYDGRGPCSHCTATLLLFHQAGRSESEQDFISRLPPSPTEAQNMPRY